MRKLKILNVKINKVVLASYTYVIKKYRFRI